ncbi:MAG: sigma factor G inhibitor Gin [Desulfitobacteriaceae bacterium]|nr:sigma factor G inhibitor Gin [Desulfitobacteriaceae bacterium]MDD4345376.1 sigma factor G inhibitor Gin [Desulfitobacteriaceae bacterium]MDD4400301.1 sigma factor G inhibitor Gin [Desulfitobacteriaceae bacterium]
MQGNIYPLCYHCGKIPELGLYDGFRIRGKFFCSSCEQAIVTMETGTQEYQDTLACIRKAIFEGMSRVKVIGL